MSESVFRSSACAQRPLVTAAAIAAGLLIAATLCLWALYGNTVFYEVILAGLNACF